MPYVSAGAAVVGAAMSAYGAYRQGQAQQEQADYQSAVMDRNAKVAAMQAEDRQRTGQIEEKQMRLKNEQMIGQAKSDLSNSGVQVGTGSSLDVVSDAAAWGEWDVQQHRWNVAKDIWGINNQAANYSAQSGLYKMSGANAAEAGMWGAGTSLISGAGTVADKWYTYKTGQENNTMLKSLLSSRYTN